MWALAPFDPIVAELGTDDGGVMSCGGTQAEEGARHCAPSCDATYGQADRVHKPLPVVRLGR